MQLNYKPKSNYYDIALTNTGEITAGYKLKNGTEVSHASYSTKGNTQTVCNISLMSALNFMQKVNNHYIISHAKPKELFF